MVVIPTHITKEIGFRQSQLYSVFRQVVDGARCGVHFLVFLVELNTRIGTLCKLNSKTLLMLMSTTSLFAMEGSREGSSTIGLTVS